MAANWAELNGVDDDDVALRRAIAMSLGEALPEEGSEPSDDGHPGNGSQVGSSPVKASMSATNPMAAMGLDRKKMEAERLARSRKRKADAESAPAAARPRLDGPSTGLTQPSKQMATPSLNSMSCSIHQGSTGLSKASSSGSLSYPKGTVRRTWARGRPREDDDITIEEIFQKEDLDLAVLSSFQWEEDWLMSKLDMKRTKVLLIAYARDDTQKAEMRNNVPQDVIRFVFPPMNSGTGCMHSKLQLLKYKGFLRIVVPTGNLVAYDWGETGTMENMVFLIDLPLIQAPTNQAINGTLTPFGEELCFFLQAQGVDDKMVSSLRKYDFAETTRYGFVHTIAGSHSEPDLWQRTGYCGLGRTVTALGLESEGDIELDYVCSSIGAVKLDLLAALYYAAQGDSGTKEIEARTAKPRKSKDASASAVDQIDLARIRVYFPSRDTVIRSRGGSNSAGTICFQSKWWNATSFPRQVLRDCRNVHSGVLMHSKIMFVRHKLNSRGWAYVGSHNLSESAWGRLVRDRTGKFKLNARNWECGVVIVAASSPSPSESTIRGTRGAAEDLDVFRNSVPIPMELPAQSYLDDERQPWFVDEA
ncbi:hypothetical protein N0V93_005685 [Gnomoniopsis smithogilvyi]|uniref:PLD phosphodiesterase domain-containing protein n=1 Tax=Gnomoniopsis smithogilvyi TaxID=1191159 RepID=A0A9W8YTS1_9PEZI|nr:hypothetical protein N0V93_005685 [Gnomoniopsis smithogilvyi]